MVFVPGTNKKTASFSIIKFSAGISNVAPNGVGQFLVDIGVAIRLLYSLGYGLMIGMFVRIVTIADGSLLSTFCGLLIRVKKQVVNYSLI